MSNLGASVNRRAFLRISGLTGAAAVAAACSPAAAPAGTGPAPTTGTGGASKAAWEKEWDELIAAAKKEGKLGIQTLTGVGYRKYVETFEQTFGIIAEHRADASASIWGPKIQKEQEAGIFTLDVAVVPPNSALSVLRPTGAWVPIKPLLFRPDVIDDKFWRDGFAARFMDKDRNLAFNWEFDVRHSIGINTSVIKEDEIKEFPDLLKPQFKGKIISDDVRTGGMYLPFTAVRKKWGDDMARKYLTEQDITFTRDQRQIAENLVRGRFPIAFGVRPTALTEFQQQGLAKDVKWLDIESVGFVPNTSIFAVKNAPHPNAAKLFINWFLTKEAQQLIANATPTVSARTDTEAGYPEGKGTPGKKYFESGNEDTYQASEDTRQWLLTVVKV
ncbi:MAG: extracellular solute-binding protein [Dehalococcoidia bacterium]|nr:extracellular solute-binding protein [Dehalococcoidia bacterium]